MAEKYIEYTIQSGDTLWDLSKKYNTTVEKLAEFNNIENPNLIYAGATLKIPVEVKEDEEAAKKTAEAVEKLKAAKAAADAKAAAEAKKAEEEANKSIFEKIADKIKGNK